jgi:Tfp pilus assembly protein PilX
VVLIFALIVLVILTIGAVALLRSMDTSLFGAGNLAFRRDLVNQGEQALANVMAEFEGTGALVTSAATDANQSTLNYSAVILPTNAQGVPLALTDDPTFLTVGVAANDITGATPDVQIRYVIDRLCSAAGIAASNLCVQSTALPPGGTANQTQGLAPPSATVYRLSVRVSGARNTQVFLQSTFTKPE